jgi:hypothetical protein
MSTVQGTLYILSLQSFQPHFDPRNIYPVLLMKKLSPREEYLFPLCRLADTKKGLNLSPFHAKICALSRAVIVKN